MFVALTIVALVSAVVVVLNLVISRAAPDGDVPRGSAPDRARHDQR